MAEEKKKIKNVSEEAKRRKRERDSLRGRTRVDLGREFVRWRHIKELEGCKSDSRFASLLLDCYMKTREKELSDDSATASQSYVVYQSFGSSESSPRAEELLVTGDDDDVNALLLTCEVQNGVNSFLQNRIVSKPSQPESIEVTLEPEQTEVQLSEPEPPAENDEDCDFSEEEEETTKRKKEGANSDEDWLPETLSEELGERKKCSSEVDSDGDSGPDETSFSGQILKKLCTECGALYVSQKPHICKHKLKPHVCNMCGRRYATEMSLKTHSKAHTDNSEHRCWCCYAVFRTRQEKVEHKQIHKSQSKPYQCRHCTCCFASFAERTKHNKIHRGPFEYKCDICGISFWVKMQLERHMVIHSGVRPYKCLFCERGFNQEGHLKSHMRLHTGERPYACPQCDKAFNHNVSLKSHMKRYHLSESEGTVDASCDGVLKKNDAQELSETGTTHDNAQKQDTEQKIVQTKHRRRRTGRPLGRPKKPAAEKIECSRSTSSSKNKDSPDDSDDGDYQDENIENVSDDASFE